MAPTTPEPAPQPAPQPAPGPTPQPGGGLTRTLAALREDYARGGLDEADLGADLRADPLALFARWFDDARAAGLHEPNAVVVATADEAGRPSLRTVLLKGVDERGFRFFTGLTSRKGRELAANAACSLLFPWHPLERQVRVEGTATPLPRDEVADYFRSRPRGSQLGAWASDQSRPVADRAALEAAYDDVVARFDGVEEVPVPERWGGFVVRPEVVEFWQGRTSRLHDRLVYERGGAGWEVRRLQP